MESGDTSRQDLKEPQSFALRIETIYNEPKFMSGKSLPPSEITLSKKYDHVILIINASSQLQHDGLRPLVQLLKTSSFIELTFNIDASHFKDSQTLDDSIVEEFKQKIKEKVAQDAVVFVYIQGHTTCVFSNSDISRDIKMAFDDLLVLYNEYWEHELERYITSLCLYWMVYMFMGAIAIDKMDSDEMVYLLAHDIQTLLAELETDFLTIFLEGYYDHSLKSELMQSRKSDKKLAKNLSEHLKSMWMAMVPSQSRVVLLTTYPEFHVTTERPCINLYDKVTAVIEKWTIAGSVSQGSHREFYESISYLLYQELRMSLGFIFIQGDKERQFCGKDYLPYEHWVAGNLSVSDNPLDKEIIVVLGSLLEFKKDEEVIIFHLLQPFNKAYGKITSVTNQYCLVKLTNDEFSSFHKLVQDICKIKLLDFCHHHFVSIKKVHKSLIKERIPVDICISDKEVTDKLITCITKSAFLRVATERDKEESVVIRHEVDRTNSTYYVIVDQAKDVTQVKVAIKNPSQLKVFLMHIAWFKYVKKLKKTKNILLNNLEYTCSATSERKLLDPALIPHKLEIKASSVLHPENSEKYSILQFTGPSQYWKPSNNGASSYIDIDLKSNHNITAVELRGDAQAEEFIKTFDLLCRTFEFQSVDISPGGKAQVESSSGATKGIVATDVQLTILNHSQFDECKFRFMQFMGTGVIPVTVGNADKPYTQDSDGWIEVLNSKNNAELTIILLFRGETLLKQLQFEGILKTESTDCKAAIKLKYVSDWRREPMEGCSSVWPVKRELFSPMKAALVRIVPTSFNKYPALQLQLHGNPVHEGKAVEVFDSEQVTFYFCNNMDKGLFFNVLCLEETGAIQLLLSEYVEQNQSKKRIMEVFLQKNYECSSTVDIYKIYVSQRKPVLDTLMQDSILDYEQPTSYSVYSFGYPTDDMMKEDPWDITDIPIHIKSSSMIYRS